MDCGDHLSTAIYTECSSAAVTHIPTSHTNALTLTHTRTHAFTTNHRSPITDHTSRARASHTHLAHTHTHTYPQGTKKNWEAIFGKGRFFFSWMLPSSHKPLSNGLDYTGYRGLSMDDYSDHTV